MIDDDVAHRLGVAALDLERIAVVRVRSHRVVADAHAHVLYEYVRGLDANGPAANHDARRWCGLAGDGQVVPADHHVRSEANGARDLEHADARSGGVGSTSLERARTTRIEVGHL